LFVGLIQIAEKTDYKEVAEYLAAFGLGLILTLNLISVFGLTDFRPIFLKPYVALLFYALTIVLNLKYYNYTKDKLNKLSDELKNKFRPNMTSGELLSILLLIESVAIALIMASVRQSNQI
jgi:hypothetical protein